jgi:hypothetical protein
MEAMRHTAGVLVGVILVTCCSPNLRAAETGSTWWPFGHRDEATTQQAPAASAPTTSPLQTPAPNVVAAQPPAVASAPLAHEAQMPSGSADTPKKEHWMFSSPNGKVSWPRLTKPHMPKTGLFAEKAQPDATRNSWAEKTPAPPKPSPLKPLTDGAHKVSKSTKDAWNKTVKALKPGESTPPASSSARIAKRDAQPSLWKRMFGGKQEIQQPQTVPEWMAQRRVEP